MRSSRYSYPPSSARREYSPPPSYHSLADTPTTNFFTTGSGSEREPNASAPVVLFDLSRGRDSLEAPPPTATRQPLVVAQAPLLTRSDLRRLEDRAERASTLLAVLFCLLLLLLICCMAIGFGWHAEVWDKMDDIGRLIVRSHHQSKSVNGSEGVGSSSSDSSSRN